MKKVVVVVVVGGGGGGMLENAYFRRAKVGQSEKRSLMVEPFLQGKEQSPKFQSSGLWLSQVDLTWGYTHN